MENSIDVGHFLVTHRLQDPQVLQPLTTEGPRMSAMYAFRRPLPLLQRGVLMKLFTSSNGLGFSCHNLSVPQLGWETRLLVLPTPLDEVNMEFRTVFMGRMIPGVNRQTLTAALKTRFGAAPVELAMMQYILFEIRRDIAIFRHKRYLPRPALGREDRQIGQYRVWASQFYPSSRG
ncbi:hypothetical protein GCM10010245_89760 [Streptomyces spectabilis]|nr:hypothetical protein GCM10010245_89760 [Streptomyces spectabilis]